MADSPRPPRIGVSINFMHADPQRPLFKGMTLQFMEQRMMLSVRRAGGIPLGLPDLGDEEGAELVLSQVDGLLITGGADVDPRTYGEEPMRPEWGGDGIRDEYEKRLVQVARRRGLPILGICRGIQLINVALGGTLYQDIVTQREGALVHRNWHEYDALGHAIRVDADSWIGQLYGGVHSLEVNSIHHQSIKDLAATLQPTAWAPDGVIEAVQSKNGDEWIMGVQWHPEWLEAQTEDPRTAAGGRASGGTIFDAFVERCREASAVV